jgi:hypothetical protein
MGAPYNLTVVKSIEEASSDCCLYFLLWVLKCKNIKIVNKERRRDWRARGLDLVG